jgi:hypothetical protein
MRRGFSSADFPRGFIVIFGWLQENGQREGSRRWRPHSREEK